MKYKVWTEEDVVFIPGLRFTRAGGTNMKGASGSGRFKLGEKVWREQV